MHCYLLISGARRSAQRWGKSDRARRDEAGDIRLSSSVTSRLHCLGGGWEYRCVWKSSALSSLLKWGLSGVSPGVCENPRTVRESFVEEGTASEAKRTDGVVP